MGDTKAVENTFFPQIRVVKFDGAGTILFGQGLASSILNLENCLVI